MTNPVTTNLERLINGPRDGALLRYSLGNEWLKAGEPERAADCLAAAVTADAHYSAAWKLLGEALLGAGRPEEAIAAWEQGIAAAEAKGDIQAAKEMKVFIKRAQRDRLLPAETPPIL